MSDLCKQTVRDLAPSYKPTSDKLQSDVTSLQKTVRCLCRSVNDNTEDITENRINIDINTSNIDTNTVAITNLQTNTVSSIFFTLSMDLSIPTGTLTKITGWNAQGATNQFALTDFSNDEFNVPVTGIYYVSSSLSWTSHASATSRQVTIRQDGTDYSGIYSSVPGDNSSSIMIIPFEAFVGEKISIYGNQESGTTLTLFGNSSNWSIIKYT